jgi:5-formyltetrahydrofolate cyclo-ligase
MPPFFFSALLISPMLVSLEHERQRLRRLFLAQRNALSAADRRTNSVRIADILMTLPEFRRAQRLFIYCHYHSEVETLDLIHRCLQAKKNVSVPLTDPDRARMLAIEVIDPATELAKGYKGIPEPLPLVAAIRQVSVDQIDVAVIPGAVFDRSGYRLGYGGGYYDRFLAEQAPQALRIGLTFALQVVEALPVCTHDVPVDILVTETEVLRWERGHR